MLQAAAEEDVEAVFLQAKEEAEEEHLKPGWSLGLLQPAPGTPLSFKAEPGTPPPTPPSQPPSPPTSQALQLPTPPHLPSTPPPHLPGTPTSQPPSPGSPGPSQPPGPSQLLVESSEEEAAQLPSLIGSPRATTQVSKAP